MLNSPNNSTIWTISKENDGSIQNASDLVSEIDEHERDKTKSSYNIILFISKIKKISENK